MKTNLLPSQYRRLFASRDVPLLLSGVFVEGYKHLEVLVTYLIPEWLSYLPLVVERKMLADGLVLYGTPGAFQDLQKEFNDYRERSRAFFETALNKSALTQEDVKRFFTLAAEIFLYYSKTEFFYTDEVFHQSKENETITKNIQELGPFKLSGRAYMNDIQLKPNGFTKRLARMIGKQFSIDFSIVMQYSQEEVLALFDGKTVPSETIRVRGKQYVSFSDGRKVTHVFGDRASRIIKRFSTQQSTMEAELHGVCASPRKAVGRARIFHLEGTFIDRLEEKIRAMEKGDIIIAETTGPEVMAACQKAAAIVTNQGGMLSHAAIVSRELGIPCVVGTGNATEIIKDGDEVEVDADNGIVRILR